MEIKTQQSNEYTAFYKSRNRPLLPLKSITSQWLQFCRLDKTQIPKPGSQHSPPTSSSDFVLTEIRSSVFWVQFLSDLHRRNIYHWPHQRPWQKPKGLLEFWAGERKVRSRINLRATLSWPPDFWSLVKDSVRITRDVFWVCDWSWEGWGITTIPRWQWIELLSFKSYSFFFSKSWELRKTGGGWRWLWTKNSLGEVRSNNPRVPQGSWRVLGKDERTCDLV